MTIIAVIVATNVAVSAQNGPPASRGGVDALATTRTGSPIPNSSISARYVSSDCQPFAAPPTPKCDATRGGSALDVVMMSTAPLTSRNTKPNPSRRFIAAPFERSRVQRAGVDHRLDFALGAQHDHEVRHHRGLSLVVERDDLLRGELGERHLDHRDGADDDLLPRGDDRLRLLSAQ